MSRFTNDSHIAELLVPHVENCFPKKISTAPRECCLKRHVKPIQKLPSKILDCCVNLVDLNLHHHYSRFDGKDWKISKRKEMMEEGLFYVYYKDEESEKIVAFVSFMLTWDDLERKENRVLYLYEIHVHSEYQGLLIGSTLIKCFHDLSKKLYQGDEEDSEVLETDGTCLTVFSDNSKAVDWYKKLGYELTESSPKDKVLRNKVVKPAYYLMIRLNQIE